MSEEIPADFAIVKGIWGSCRGGCHGSMSEGENDMVFQRCPRANKTYRPDILDILTYSSEHFFAYPRASVPFGGLRRHNNSISGDHWFISNDVPEIRRPPRRGKYQTSVTNALHAIEDCYNLRLQFQRKPPSCFQRRASKVEPHENHTKDTQAHYI